MERRKPLKRGGPLKRKSALKTKSGLRDRRQDHPGPDAAARAAGIAAQVAKRRQRAGVPSDAPKNKHGQSCVEKKCVICGEAFLAIWNRRASAKTCSRACAAKLKKQRGGTDRHGESNPNYRHGRRSGVRDRGGEERWYAVKGSRCCHPRCKLESEVMAQHHVVYAQAVRKHGGDVWDPRNGLTVCDSCHSSHHQRGTRVIPLSTLRDDNYEFAFELLGRAAYDYLKRRYAGEDRRLDALLAR